jgi:hypothetical protein
MSGSLTLLGFDGDVESVVAALRAASGRVHDLGARLSVFLGASKMMGADVPAVLALVQSSAPPSESTLAATEKAVGLTPTFRATFAYLRSFGAHTGETTRSLLMGMTDCASPEARAEFEAWYDEHHAIDVVRSGLYFVAERHRRAAGDAPEFLAVYATTGDEPETFQRYFAWEDRDRARTAAALVRNVWTFRLAFASPEVMTWN